MPQSRSGSQDFSVRGWLDTLALERGLSSRTREAYAGDVAALAAYLVKARHTPAVAGGGGGADAPDWTRVSREDLEAFLSSCREGGYSEASCARRLVAMKSFFAWMKLENKIAADPSTLLAQPRKSRRLPHALSEEEVARLLEAPSADTPEGLRDRAALELLYGSGLRVSELVGLTRDAVNFDDGLLRILGKGSKTRIVPFGSRAAAALRAWLERGRPACHPAAGLSAVFVNDKGRPLTRQAMWTAIKAHARAAGITEAISPHWLRHSFATHLLSHDAPIRVIQELLGHADVGTTQIYTHVSTTRLASIVKKLHPRG